MTRSAHDHRPTEPPGSLFAPRLFPSAKNHGPPIDRERPLPTPSPKATPMPEDRAGAALAEWRAFHEDNPQVWLSFEGFALEAAAAGRRRVGARMIWEQMRWHTEVVTRSGDFKLNDHWPPFYARLFLERHPELPDFFETRAALADSA